MGAALDQALVCHHGARQHVDPDESGARRRGDRQRRLAIVAQDVDPDRDRDGAAGFPDRHRHAGDGFRRRVVRIKRHIVEVLHEQAIEPGSGQRARFRDGLLHNGREIASVARRTGERQQMHHPDKRLLGTEQLIEVSTGHGRHPEAGTRPHAAAVAAGLWSLRLQSQIVEESRFQLPQLLDARLGVVEGGALGDLQGQQLGVEAGFGQRHLDLLQ